MLSSLLGVSNAKWFVALCLLSCVCPACVDDQSLEFNPVLSIAPSCFDGIKNQDETSIDCGGVCSNYCDESIRASCSYELQQNVFSSDSENITYELADVLAVQARDEYFKVSAEIVSGSGQVNIYLPLQQLPKGNTKFYVGTLDYESDTKAFVEISTYYQNRKAHAGELYVRFDGDKVHLEFCHLFFWSEYDYYNDTDYSYEGNLSFRLADIINY